MTPEDIRKDREAGTDGPWMLRQLENFGWNIVHYVGGDKYTIRRIAKVGKDEDIANARRIARLPELEEAYLAQAAEIEMLKKKLAEIDG